MIGLDTNVILRQLTQDDAVQSPIASALFEKIDEQYPAYIGLVAVLEVAWVLKRAYQLDNASIAHCFEQLLSTSGLYLQFSDVVSEAVERIKYQSKLDFPDVLLALLNERADCQQTLTFDKMAVRYAGMTLLK